MCVCVCVEDLMKKSGDPRSLASLFVLHMSNVTDLIRQSSQSKVKVRVGELEEGYEYKYCVFF